MPQLSKYSDPSKLSTSDCFVYFQTTMGSVWAFQNQNNSLLQSKRRLLRKISKCFQLALSTVRNIVLKWKLYGTVSQVKTKSGRPKPNLWSNLQNRTRTDQCCLPDNDLQERYVRRKPSLWPHHNFFLKYVKENLKLTLLGTKCFGLMWCKLKCREPQLLKIYMEREKKRVKHLKKRIPCQPLSLRVVLLWHKKYCADRRKNWFN